MFSQIMKETLMKLGLGNKEVDVYIALLKLQKTGVEQIKKETKIERTHIYKILERLQDKNFATEIIENKTKKFIPLPPEEILYDLKETEQRFKDILPKLKAITQEKPKEETKITVYRRKEGLRKLAEEILSTTKEYLVIGEQGQFQEIFPYFSKQFLKRIQKQGIKERVIAKKGMNVIKAQNTTIKYAPKQYDFLTTTIIYNNNVITIIWSEPVAIKITNKELASSHKNQFEAIWKIAKK